jgi:glucose-6-phosphate 1-dehydrogenase
MTLTRASLHDIVIVGATGDLSRRKLLPSLYRLFAGGVLPEQFAIIGFARSRLDTTAFHELARESIERFAEVQVEEETWHRFAGHLAYVGQAAGGYDELRECCQGDGRIFYLALPPEAVERVVRDLQASGLNRDSRVVVEKPFGLDASSARQLNQALHAAFDESQIYRIDHYLGKETVQNLLVFRFTNALFERVWNRDAIDHIQLTVAESIGVEGRGRSYDGVGALRDIVQNHVLQMLAMLTMEPPASFDPERIRDERMKLLRTVRPVRPARAVRGQYGPGATAEGSSVPGYRAEENVPPDSDTETYVALELAIDNWRWAGVPIHVRAGKRMPYRATELEVAFKGTPINYVPADEIALLHQNHLVYRVQPDEAITLRFLAKLPGPAVAVKDIDLQFTYRDGFMVRPAEAYDRLLHDVMLGDQTLFVRADAIERAWEIVQPLLDAPPPLHSYPAGTWGPVEAGALVAPGGWHLS